MPKQITLRTLHHIYFVSTKDVLYCKSNNSSTTFYMMDESNIVVSKGMKAVCNILDGEGFIRPHQSYIVNKSHIIRMDKKETFSLVLSNHTTIPIALRRKKEILEILQGNFQS